jgi:hypothetical protein
LKCFGGTTGPSAANGAIGLVILDASLDAAGACADITTHAADILTNAADGIASAEAAENNCRDEKENDIFHKQPF